MKNLYAISSFLSLLIITVACSPLDKVSMHELSAYNPEPIVQENYKDHGENPFISTSEAPVSTFSVDADGGSYANMRRFLNLGQTPPVASVRIEEYINYFTFDYPEPQNGDNVGLNSEVSICPWNTDHHLIRIGMKGKTIPESELPNSNYVFLIDVSGSMSSPDKLGILKSGFKTLTDNLRDDDRIAIVTYAGSAGVLLPSTSGSEKDKIKQAIDQLGAGGSTAGAEGIITAYKIVEEHFISDGNNRVILGSDGDFNVGPSSTEALVELIEKKRKTGIYLTVLGVGGGNLNDYGMEQIANKGNGNYEHIDNAKQIQKVFTYELGKLYTVAKDSKIQVTFNENKVSSYRLIGYENRALENEDFEDDTEDAGEIGSSQTITALYEVVLKDNTEALYATFDFRYKKPNTEISIPLAHEIKESSNAIISENMNFATAVTGFGLLMKNSEYKGNVSKQMVIDLASGATSFDPNGFRQEFIELVTHWNN
ncbi:vWA domain-containing protein [Hyunsoonleella ulvae]|uniref:vWA domain-containing protein n=1 Tax=Hyunsoonleella ulvae TaxID=2799948 RepID=UPI001939884D|nr:VWA domain-containing protein [Hyunsoonleella ulvae]